MKNIKSILMSQLNNNGINEEKQDAGEWEIKFKELRIPDKPMVEMLLEVMCEECDTDTLQRIYDRISE